MLVMLGLFRRSNCVQRLTSVLSETPNHFSLLSGLSQQAQIRGGGVHDARIAAICIEHQVEEFWTLDRDFQRFPDLRLRNPLVASLHEPMVSYRST
jgi:predicted nucleic acid-binding protein